jgi:hypothetical protein
MFLVSINYKRGIQNTNPRHSFNPNTFWQTMLLILWDSLKLKKHVICEKPMCLKISDAKEIVKFSKIIKKKVYVVMQNKFNISC